MKTVTAKGEAEKRHSHHLDPSKIPFLQNKKITDLSQMSISDYNPKRFGLKYNPPTIILEYLVPSTGKLYHHKMRLTNLKKTSNLKEFVIYLRKRHVLYLMDSRVKEKQLEDLVENLQKSLPEEEKSIPGKVHKESKVESIPIENKQPNITGNKGVKMRIPSKKKPFAEDKKNIIGLGGTFLTANPDTPPHKKNYSLIEKNNHSGVKIISPEINQELGWDAPREIDFAGVDYQNYDLNQLSDEELDAHKQHMEEQYIQNYKKPEDKGFIYDFQYIDWNEQQITQESFNFEEDEKYDDGWDEDEAIEEEDDEDLLP